MKFFDLHCDTLSRLIDIKKQNPLMSEDLFSNSGHIDIKRLLDNKTKDMQNIQVFAIFCGEDPEKSVEYMNLQIEYFFDQVKKYSSYIMQCRNRDDIIKALKANKIPAVLSVEGMNFPHSESLLKKFKDIGVKILGFSWNYSGNFCESCEVGTMRQGPSSLEENSGVDSGLTGIGEQAVKFCNDHGMMIDVSHSSDKTIQDILNISSMPIVATHSNSYAIHRHKRNLTDDLAKKIAEKGGIIGINFYPEFLSDKNISDVNDIIKHINHFGFLLGSSHIAIGSDFDGIRKVPRGIEDCSKYDDFVKYLKNETDNDKLNSILSKNFMNLLRS